MVCVYKSVLCSFCCVTRLSEWYGLALCFTTLWGIPSLAIVFDMYSHLTGGNAWVGRPGVVMVCRLWVRMSMDTVVHTR